MSAARILEAALAAGAREAEVYLKRSHTSELGRAGGRDVTRRSGRESGAGLRLVTRDRRVGFLAFSPLERRPARAELRRCLELARPAADPVRLPAASAGSLGESAAPAPDPRRLERVAQALERGMDAVAGHARQAVSARVSRIDVEVLNTRGLGSKACIRLASLDAWCLAERAGERFELRETRLTSKLEIGEAEAFGHDVAERAARCLGGRPMERPSGDVWLHPSVTALLLAMLAGELHAGEGRRVGSRMLELSVPLEAPGELPFDGEGRQRRTLTPVRRGWLRPLPRRALRTRKSYAEPPVVGLPCLRLEPSAGPLPGPGAASLQLLAASVAPTPNGPQLLLSGVSRHPRAHAPVTLVMPGSKALTWLGSLKAAAGAVHYYPFATTVGARGVWLNPHADGRGPSVC